MVPAVIGGPTAGPVPNAGGRPAGGAAGGGGGPRGGRGPPGGLGVSARATRPTAAAPSRPRTGPFKNCLRELGMAGTVLETGSVAVDVTSPGPRRAPRVDRVAARVAFVPVEVAV